MLLGLGRLLTFLYIVKTGNEHRGLNGENKNLKNERALRMNPYINKKQLKCSLFCLMLVLDSSLCS